MKKLVTIHSISAIERMNEIINEMKKLQEELETIMNTNEKIEDLETIMNTNEKIEDLDSFENIPDDELYELIDDEYDAWIEANDDDDEEEIEEPEIYNIYFTIEDFETIMEYLDEIPFGYVFDSIENEYIVRMDEEMVDEMKELLEKWAYIEKYENCCSSAYQRIVSIQDAIFYGVHYNL